MQNITAAAAIEESILRDRIVTIDATPDDVEALKTECDDWVENGPEIEFWGRDDDGDNWRVHVRAEGK